MIERVFSTLAEPCLPADLRIEDAGGDFAISKPGHVLALSDSDKARLEQLTKKARQLSYSLSAPESARNACIAAATKPGMPIAGDNQTLALLTLAGRIATSDIPVLIEGPTGTGKEVLAQFLHNASARADQPFIAVNCAAMPEAMLEALLFGHCKGAFTGASAAGEGFFRAADGGTLLLDEIGEMPLSLQAKLLRTVQEGEVVPLGATKPVKVDVRIVACTNRELPGEVAQGRFREDLYYRLNVFPLHMPALRERRADIAPLAFGMLLRHAARPNMPGWIDKDAIDVLETHDWPGNVRELENVIRRAIVLAGTDEAITAEHIQFDRPVRSIAANDTAMRTGEVVSHPASDRALAEARSLDRSLSDIAFESEAQAILDTLERCNGHRGKTAEQLGISERTLRYRLANMREAGLAVAGAGR
ncbi:sigma-54 interaction domain-containing protein [Erythrobacter sp. HA6-11]